MTYGSNPNGTGIPFGAAGHTNIPLPTAQAVVKPPTVVHRSGVSDGDEDDIDYGTEDPAYSVGESGGLFGGLTSNTAQPGEPQIDLIEGDPSQDDIIYGTDDGGANGIGDDTIEGDDGILGGPLSDEEMDKVIFGEDGGLDDIIEGNDPDEMSDEDFQRTVYGESDEPEVRRPKKITYRATGGKPRNTPVQPNTGMGMTQQDY